VTGFYAIVFYLFRGFASIDKLLVALLLNDPAIIGFLFIGLAIIIEKNSQVLSAIAVSPINHHLYVISKVLSLSLLGCFCTIGLAYAAVGWSFNFFELLVGSFTICVITTLLGVILVSYTFEFLKFCLYSLPFIVVFVNLPLLDYLDVIDLGFLKHLSPIQPSLDILISSLNQDQDQGQNLWLKYILSFTWMMSIYIIAFKLFNKKVLDA
jgi:fluoroquinolone transport system permease protein